MVTLIIPPNDPISKTMSLLTNEHGTATNIKSLKFVHEQNIIQQFFSRISKDTGLICFGLKNTLKALEEGIVKTLILWESIGIVVTNTENEIKYEIKEITDESEIDFIEYLSINKSARYGANIEIVSNKTDIGTQFVQGFGGIGAILNYRMTTDYNSEVDEWSDNDNFDDY